jgi:hypothetical protein
MLEVNLANLMIAANQQLGFVFFNSSRHFFVFLCIATGIRPENLIQKLKDGALQILEARLNGIFYRLEFDEENSKFNFFGVEICNHYSLPSFKPNNRANESLSDMYERTQPRNSNNDNFVFELNYTRGQYNTYKSPNGVNYLARIETFKEGFTSYIVGKRYNHTQNGGYDVVLHSSRTPI